MMAETHIIKKKDCRKEYHRLSSFLPTNLVLRFFRHISYRDVYRKGSCSKLDTLPFTKTDIRDILHLCLKNSYFQFNDKFHQQKTGLPMGNTLSPILAEFLRMIISNNTHGRSTSQIKSGDTLMIY